MFIPCDHCLRKHATQTLEGFEAGERKLLRLCNDCFRKEKQNFPHAPISTPTQLTEEDLIRRAEDVTRGLVAALLPKEIPRIPGFDMGFYYRPAKDIQADYFECFKIDENHLGLIIADVSGGGIPGSIVMTETRALVKSEAVKTVSPAETLARVNRVLQKDIKRGMFVTAYYAVLQPNAAIITCASAGHNPMLFSRREPNTCHMVNPNGLALGIDKGPLFEKTLKEQTIQLLKGDRFTVYTDGVTEVMNLANESFGQNRFLLSASKLAAMSSSEFLLQLVTELEAHQGDAPQDDDWLILTGRYEGST